ncbi:MAG: putative metal-binding protein [Gemmatimonadaceae bacterium]
MTATLVDPAVTREKFQREYALWDAYPHRAERGWVLLAYEPAQLAIEIAFMGQLTLSVGSSPLPIVACAIRLTYENYDLWAPSLTFIDPFTRRPVKPHLAAVMLTPGGLRNVLIDAHPTTRLPFLCLPGIREYHSHPQHTGDDWLLHRAMSEGSLSNICERIWRLMVTNIVGLTVAVQALPTWPLQAQLEIQIAQSGPMGIAGSGNIGVDKNVHPLPSHA